MNLDDVLDQLVPPERAGELKARWKREEMGLMFQLLTDMRSTEETTCSRCDGPIHVGDRSLVVFSKPMHRSCLSAGDERIAEFRRLRRYARKPKPETADPRQTSLFQEK